MVQEGVGADNENKRPRTLENPRQFIRWKEFDQYFDSYAFTN